MRADLADKSGKAASKPSLSAITVTLGHASCPSQIILQQRAYSLSLCARGSKQSQSFFLGSGSTKSVSENACFLFFSYQNLGLRLRLRLRPTFFSISLDMAEVPFWIRIRLGLPCFASLPRSLLQNVGKAYSEKEERGSEMLCFSERRCACFETAVRVQTLQHQSLIVKTNNAPQRTATQLTSAFLCVCFCIPHSRLCLASFVHSESTRSLAPLSLPLSLSHTWSARCTALPVACLDRLG